MKIEGEFEDLNNTGPCLVVLAWVGDMTPPWRPSFVICLKNAGFYIFIY